jgi:hypothetical protein
LSLGQVTVLMLSAVLSSLPGPQRLGRVRDLLSAGADDALARELIALGAANEDVLQRDAEDRRGDPLAELRSRSNPATLRSSSACDVHGREHACQRATHSGWNTLLAPQHPNIPRGYLLPGPGSDDVNAIWNGLRHTAEPDRAASRSGPDA